MKNWQSPSRDPWSNCLINSRKDDKGQSYYYSGRQKDNSKTVCGHLGYHLGVQLDLCIFGALPPIQHISNDICPSVMQNDLLRPSSLLHHLFLTSDFCQVPRRNVLQFFQFLVHRCFRCRIFFGLRRGRKIVNQIIMLQ